MNVHLRSAFQYIHEAHQMLAVAQGAVVNVSSVHPIAASANVAAYAVSKGALCTLTQSTALELADDGIRCNAVLPGAVDTHILRRGTSCQPHPGAPDGYHRALAERTPLGFVASPIQIAPITCFLADGDQSPYMTGQAIAVDAGPVSGLPRNCRVSARHGNNVS